MSEKEFNLDDVNFRNWQNKDIFIKYLEKKRKCLSIINNDLDKIVFEMDNVFYQVIDTDYTTANNICLTKEELIDLNKKMYGAIDIIDNLLNSL